jgi:hypothetical protein
MKLNSYLMREAFLDSDWRAALGLLHNEFGIKSGYLIPRIHVIDMQSFEQITATWDCKIYSWDSTAGFRILPHDNFFSGLHIWTYSSGRRP